MKPSLRTGNFTLLELLIVIAILLILVSLLLPSLRSARCKALQVQCTGNLKQIYNAVGISLPIPMDIFRSSSSCTIRSRNGPF